MSDAHERFGQRLLASVRRERPSAELRDRILALGRAERARLAAGLTPLSPKAEGASGRWLRERSVRWALGIAAAAALAFAIGQILEEPPSILLSAERARATAARAPATLPPPDSPSPAPAVIPSSSSSSMEVTKANKTVPPPAKPLRADAGSASSELRSTLAEQLEQIKKARAALRAGDHARAIALIDVYQAASKQGELRAEASLLRIEALAASGQRSEAARHARQFAIDHPNSPLIDRALAFAVE